MSLKREDIELPDELDKKKIAFVVRGAFSKQECEEFIRRTEEVGYEEALVNTGPRPQDQVLIRDYRHSFRCIIDDFDVSKEIFERIKHFLPPHFRSRELVGVNERLRFLKYQKGDFFQPHQDGSLLSKQNCDPNQMID